MAGRGGSGWWFDLDPRRAPKKKKAASRRKAPAKRKTTARGKRLTACQLCEKQMAAQAKRLQTAQKKREAQLFERVKRATPVTGERVRMTPTGLTERRIVMPGQFRSTGFSSFGAGAHPFFSGRDPRRKKSKKRGRRDPIAALLAAARDPRRKKRRGRHFTLKTRRTPRGVMTRTFSFGRRDPIALLGPARDPRRTRTSRMESYGYDPVWRGQPIRHKRARVLGWERQLGGRRPENPKFGGHRPVLFHPVGKKRHRDPDPTWFGEPERHREAAYKGFRTRKRLKRCAAALGKRGGRPRSRGRDPRNIGWPDDYAGHRRAALKGLGRDPRRNIGWPDDRAGHSRAGYKGWSHPRRDVALDPSWFGQPRRHRKAALKGIRRRRRVGRRDVSSTFRFAMDPAPARRSRVKDSFALDMRKSGRRSAF